jgi:ABC-type glycerol-3-phosphate transport system substrate-binding protein
MSWLRSGPSDTSACEPHPPTTATAKEDEMRLRRWISYSIALVSIGASAACGGGQPGSSRSNTIRLATVTTDRAPMEAVIKAFKAQNPDVTIRAEYLDTEPIQAAMRTQLSAGTA